ncbi:hypothetical protein [Coleofasciculus sp.]|uniref:hypothetical protein n=1 Tax=Coleofasciculus sp. TaxID=3100458 RepID=UPI0039F8EF71
MQFDAPLVDQQRDIRLWEDGDGQLIALAGLMIPAEGDVFDGVLWFRVYPKKLTLSTGKLRLGQNHECQTQERRLAVKLLSDAGVEQGEAIA